MAAFRAAMREARAKSVDELRADLADLARARG
jgi:hypothetical protein